MQILSPAKAILRIGTIAVENVALRLMICPTTGDVVFDDFRLGRHVGLQSFAGKVRAEAAVVGQDSRETFPGVDLGKHTSGGETFRVGVLLGTVEFRIAIVFLRWLGEVAEESLREVVHAEIVERDLSGQSRHSWGSVTQNQDESGRAWLILVYHGDSHVMLEPVPRLSELKAYAE